MVKKKIKSHLKRNVNALKIEPAPPPAAPSL